MADTYDVTGQRRTTIVNDAGAVEDAVEITFKTKPNGTESMITVPASRYSVDEVRTELEAAAATIEGVHSL